MSVIIRKPRENEKPDCASLIYASAPHLFKFLTKGNKEICHKYIEIFLNYPNTSYAMENIMVEEVQDQIRGLLLAYPTTAVKNKAANAKACKKEVRKLLGWVKWIRLFLISKFEDHKPEMDKEYFISALAVFESFRGRGIALRLLKKAESLCKEQGIKKLSLCVTVKNKRAYKIYKEFGFKEEQTIMFPKRYERFDMYGFIKMVKLV